MNNNLKSKFILIVKKVIKRTSSLIRSTDINYSVIAKFICKCKEVLKKIFDKMSFSNILVLIKLLYNKFILKQRWTQLDCLNVFVIGLYFKEKLINLILFRKKISLIRRNKTYMLIKKSRQIIRYIFNISSYIYKKLIFLYSCVYSFLNEIEYSILYKKIKAWLYEDVYKVIKFYGFIYLVSKYKKLTNKKPRKMSILYFYWLEYNLYVYIGLAILLFYYIYIFQFELIFYYFPDIFILQLNDLMKDPQLSFSSTDSFLVDSYIYSQVERKQLNVSTLVGGSSYLIFKYKRFIRGIQYIHSNELIVPFWTNFPINATFWDGKAQRLPGNVTHAISYSRKPFKGYDGFAKNWYRLYLKWYKNIYKETKNGYRSAYKQNVGGLNRILWHPMRAKYGAHNRPHMMAYAPLAKTNTTPFFFLHLASLTEQRKYKQKLLFRQIFLKLSSSKNGQNLLRLLSHRKQKSTDNVKLTIREFIRREIIEHESEVMPLARSMVNDQLFLRSAEFFYLYLSHMTNLFKFIGETVFKNSQTIEKRPLHLNDMMFAHVQRSMYNYFDHYNYKFALKNTFAVHFFKFLKKKKQVQRYKYFFPNKGDEMAFPHEYKNAENPSNYENFPNYYNNLKLQYTKNLTGWFRRYSEKLYEKEYKTRVPPYRIVMGVDFFKKGRIFSDDVYYKMFFNNHAQQDPSGMGYSKRFFNEIQRRKKVSKIDLIGLGRRKRYRNMFLNDEFLVLNSYRPPRVFKVRDFFFDNFRAFMNVAMTQSFAVDAPSRESFWKRFFSRYSYKKKDYYFVGKRLYEFDKYMVDFDRRYGDFMFLMPERLFSFISSIIYHIKRRQVFFLAKPYGQKNKVEFVEVNDTIISNIKSFLDKFLFNFFFKIYIIIKMIFKRIFYFIYNLFVFFTRSIYRFFYSFFHLSFILTKFFELCSYIFNSLIKRFTNIKLIKNLFINENLLQFKNDITRHTTYSFSIFNYFYNVFFNKIYLVFEQSIFYTFILNKLSYVKNILRSYNNYIIDFFYDYYLIFNLKTGRIFRIFEEFLFPFIGRIINLKDLSLFSVSYISNSLLGVVKNIIEGLFIILKELIILLFKILVNIIFELVYIFVSKKRAKQIHSFIFFWGHGGYRIKLYKLKSFFIRLLTLNLKNMTAQMKVYLEERSLKRMRYKTLVLNNRRNSYIWLPSHRLLWTKVAFWSSICAFFYLWLTYLKMAIDLDEHNNIETVLFFFIPIVVGIILMVTTVNSAAYLDVLIPHGFDSLLGLMVFAVDTIIGSVL